MKISSKILLLIVVFGTFLRFYNIDHKMRFIWDEGRDMLAIRHMLIHKDLTLFGPFNEIDGKKDFFGVFHYYLMAPALYLFNYNPLGPAVFTASLGVASIILCYLLIRRWHNETIALAVASIYAVSPLIVKYVQWPWNPNTTPFFALLYLLSLTELVKRRSFIFSLISGLLLGLLFQLHYFSLPLGLAWLVVVLTRKFSRLGIHGLLFVFFFILPNLTFVIFDITHDHFYWNILEETFGGFGKQGYFSFNFVLLLISLWSSTVNVFTNLFGGQYFIGIIASLLYWSRSVTLWSNFRKEKNSSVELWLYVSWMGYCFLVACFQSLADEYHALPFIVGLMVSLWLSISQLLSILFSNQKDRNWIIISCYCILLPYLFVANKPFRQPTWDENMPLIYQVAALVAGDVGKQAFNIASLVDADTRAIRFRYFLDVFNKDSDGIEEYSQSNILYVVTYSNRQDFRQEPAWELASFISFTPSYIGSVGDYRLWKFEKY